jgi:hypothetical protein
MHRDTRVETIVTLLIFSSRSRLQSIKVAIVDITYHLIKRLGREIETAG